MIARNSDTFQCRDKVVLAPPTPPKAGAFKVTEAQDRQIVSCVCVIGNQDVPDGAEVLVPAQVVPSNQKTQLPDGREVFVVGMDRVVAWRLSAGSGGQVKLESAIHPFEPGGAVKLL